MIINLLHDFPSALNVTWSMAYIAHGQDLYYEGIDHCADGLMRCTDIPIHTILQGSVVAMALLTKNCHCCHAQRRLLKKIVTTCPALRPVMVGIGECKQPLLRALRQSQNKFPAFLINRNLSNALDNLNVPK